MGLGREGVHEQGLTPEGRVARWRDSPWHEKGFYENGLPPPSRKLEICTVIPVYREYEDQVLWHILRDAANQTLPSEKFEIILVVNNSAVEARQQTPAFLDNQRLLFVVRTLRAAIDTFAENPTKSRLRSVCDDAFATLSSADVELSAGQQQLFEKAVKKQIRIFAIDASSEESAALEEGDEYNPIGVARHIGSKVAARRFSETDIGAQGLIDFVDADCGFPPNYYEALTAAGKQHKGARAFGKDVKTYAPSIPEWKSLSPLARVGNLIDFLRTNITKRRAQYQGTEVRWAPQPVVRADLLYEIGGYSYEGGNEDFAFGDKITGTTKPVFLDSTHVRLSDRASDRGADGKRWKHGTARTTEEAESFAETFDPRNLKNLGGEDYSAFTTNVLGTDKELNVHADYRAMRAHRWKVEVEQSKRRVAALRQTVHIVVEKISKIKPTLETFTKDENYRKWLTKHFAGTLDAQTIDYLAENPILMAALVTATKLVTDAKGRDALGITEGTTEHMAWEFFEKYLPEYFVALPDTEPDYDAMRAGAEQGILPEGCSVRYLTHLIAAHRDWRAAHNR